MVMMRNGECDGHHHFIYDDRVFVGECAVIYDGRERWQSLVGFRDYNRYDDQRLLQFEWY